MRRKWFAKQSASIFTFGRSLMPSTSPRTDSEGLGMLRSRVVVATFLVATCASCGHEAATQTPSSSTTPASPTTSTSPELAGYSAEEQAAYSDAVAQYDTFIEQSNAFYAAGDTTVAAKDFYQKYAIDWSTAWANLAQVANNGARVTGSTKTIWTKPRSIKANADGDVVVLRRCVDSSGLVITQSGSPVPQPESAKQRVYTIRMERRQGEDWWRSGIARRGATC